MKLLRTSNTALLFASILAKDHGEKNISLSQISTDHGISVLFLKRIARALLKANIVTSKEGVGGGYRLSRPAGKISVWDVLRAVDSMDKKNDFPSHKICPINKNCLPQKIQSIVGDALKNSFSDITIDTFI